jgi:putative oxidoreductase
MEISIMEKVTNEARWSMAAVHIGRLIFAAVFIMAATFKFIDISGTADYIASAGFTMPKILA